MKKITIILTAAVMLIAGSAFATEGDNVTAKVKAGFSKDFATAAQVSWEKNSDFYFANFLLNGKNASAAYNEAGELVGTSQTMGIADLPLDVTLAISEKYGNYKVSPSVTELNYDGKTSYYVTVENDLQTLQLKCDNTGDIVVDKKTKK
jgi:hypothetical protein